MKIHHGVLVLSGVLMASSAAAQNKVDQQIRQAENKPMAAPQERDLGKAEYEAQCALCHGLTGKGMGPYSDALKRSPPDLTILSKRNGGIFPISRVYSTIEGAEASHGTREMPIWGRRYRVDAAAHHFDADYNEAAFVRGRILGLVDYLNRIQER